MVLEKGDYFAITRGIKLNKSHPFSLFGFMGLQGESWKENNQEEAEPSYDRSYNDCIFLAREVCMPMVAAEIIHGHSYGDKVVSLRLTEIEVMTVTKQYVEELLGNKQNNPIYKPTGKAAEYAHLALNLYTGCDNGCTYCYSPSVLHVSREDFAKCKPREGILEALEKQLPSFMETKDRVLLCFACDPYPEYEFFLTGQVLTFLKIWACPFQILTKSGSRALIDISTYGPNDAFASTLTFINPKDSKHWEPNAALPQERMDTLRKFHEAGIHTWVSLEPVIDPEQTLELIRQTAPFVDLYKVGKLNYVKSKVNWRMFGARAIKILESLGKKYYIKADLAKHLDGIPYTNTDNRSVGE